MSNVGKPVTKFTSVPNFKSQIKNINAILEKHNIQHGDIHLENILIKENVLHLIDFEWANDKKENAEWQPRRGHSPFYQENKYDMWLHKKGLPDPEPYSSFQEYIENTYG
jgi:serine/threonine protein kinase